MFYQLEIPGPFLIVVPLSTASNWMKESKKWVPEMNSVRCRFCVCFPVSETVSVCDDYTMRSIIEIAVCPRPVIRRCSSVLISHRFCTVEVRRVAN